MLYAAKYQRKKKEEFLTKSRSRSIENMKKKTLEN